MTVNSLNYPNNLVSKCQIQKSAYLLVFFWTFYAELDSVGKLSQLLVIAGQIPLRFHGRCCIIILHFLNGCNGLRNDWQHTHIILIRINIGNWVGLSISIWGVPITPLHKSDLFVHLTNCCFCFVHFLSRSTVGRLAHRLIRTVESCTHWHTNLHTVTLFYKFRKSYKYCNMTPRYLLSQHRAHGKRRGSSNELFKCAV